MKRISKKLLPLENDPAWKKLKHPDDWKVRDASEGIDTYAATARRRSTFTKLSTVGEGLQATRR